MPSPKEELQTHILENIPEYAHAGFRKNHRFPVNTLKKEIDGYIDFLNYDEFLSKDNCIYRAFYENKKTPYIATALILNFVPHKIRTAYILESLKINQIAELALSCTFKNYKGEISNVIILPKSSQYNINDLINALKLEQIDLTVAQCDKNVVLDVFKDLIKNNCDEVLKVFKTVGTISKDELLLSNCVIKSNGEVIRSNSVNEMQISDKLFYMVESQKQDLPTIHESKATPNELAQDLILTFKLIFEEKPEPFISFGLGIMSLFAQEYRQGIGFPILIAHGTQESGKTVLLDFIGSLFGMSNGVKSGDSTKVAIEIATSEMPNIPVLYDEIPKEYLNSERFESLVKSLNAVKNREKALKSGLKTVKNEICTTAMFATNEEIPRVGQLATRFIELSLDTGDIDFNKKRFNYQLVELSNLLPLIFNFDKDERTKLYKESFELFNSNIEGISNRLNHNYAIAMTGIKILEAIAEQEIVDIDTKLIEFVKQANMNLQSAESPLDMILNSFVTLQGVGLFKHYTQYFVVEPKDKINGKRCIAIHAGSITLAYNAFFRADKSKHIDKSTFTRLMKKDKRCIDVKHTAILPKDALLKSEAGTANRVSTYLIDISNHPDCDLIMSFYKRSLLNERTQFLKELQDSVKDLGKDVFDETVQKKLDGIIASVDNVKSAATMDWVKRNITTEDEVESVDASKPYPWQLKRD